MILTYSDLKKYAKKKFANNAAPTNKRQALAQIISPLKDLVGAIDGNAAQSGGATAQPVGDKMKPTENVPASASDNEQQPGASPQPKEDPIIARIKKVAAFAKERKERLPDPPEVAMEKLDQALDRSMLFMKQSKQHIGENQGDTDMDVKIDDTVLNAATQKPRGGGVGN